MNAQPQKAPVSQYDVKVLSRALGILEILSRTSGLTLGEITKRSGLHKSTVHRLLRVLERHNYIDRGRGGGNYTLGLKLFELGTRALAQLDIHERAKPYLERLVFETGETAHLCTLDDDEVLYLEKVEAPRTVRIPSTVGKRYPAHCGASGKALLAFVPEQEVDDLIRHRGMESFTKNTITTPVELKKALKQVSKRGYALDEEEFEEGLKCIAAPVRNHSGQVIASLGIAGLAFRLTDDKIPALAESVMENARQLSAELGMSAS